jgi:hypothetical protein
MKTFYLILSIITIFVSCGLGAYLEIKKPKIWSAFFWMIGFLGGVFCVLFAYLANR